MLAPAWPAYIQSREDVRVIATEPSPIWTNEVCRFPVPAGLEMTIELRGHSQGTGSARTIRPAVLAERIMLKPGEVLNVGEVKIDYAAE